ncbi:hypothetical protein [Salinigranum marinum]|uniref:hypothetical protein n=1 Tax=Salinigranum marinum TaxID=1515595 RepID=UPI003CCD8A0F
MTVRLLGVGLPTTRSDVRLVARTTRLVLSVPVYALFATLVALATLSAFVLSQNLALVGDVVLGGSLPLAARLRVLVELYPFVGTSYSLLSGTALVVVAALTGVDLAMVAYHVREHGLSAEGSGGSAAGVVLGALGAGCAACGSAVLAGVLSLVGASGLALLLPFDGVEFAVLASVALVLSMYWLADGMRGGSINGCPVDP